MMRHLPKPKAPVSGQQATTRSQTSSQLVPDLAQKLQASPRLREQQQLQKMVKQSPRQGGQSKDDSGLSAAEKAMLLHNALLAQQDEEKQKKR